MFRVNFDGLYEFQSSDLLSHFSFPLARSQRSSCSRASIGEPHLCDVVKIDKNLVYFAIGKSAHDVSIFVIRFLPFGALLSAALLLSAVLVHEVVLVVEVILTNTDIAKGVGDGLGRRSLEVLQESLEGGWKGRWSVCGSRRQYATGGTDSIVPRSPRALSN